MAEVTRSVGRYELIDVVGRGGAGIVYRARQTDLGRLVALKRLVDLHGDGELVQRFLREARLGGGLTHPNIVTVYEYLDHEGDAYIAMELMPHGSLRGYVGSLDLAQAGGVLDGVLSALSYAAERLVHRDVKPENVLVGADGRVKLADFGIARAIGITTAASLTAGAILGSPAYMAPEQATGGEIGPWTDLYSTGVVAYELLVGERPHPAGGTLPEALHRLVNAPIRAPLQLRPDLDPGLAGWLEHMLRKDPANRMRSAAQARDELEEHLIRLLGERWRRASAIAVAPLAPLPEPDAPPAGRPSESATSDLSPG
jgi:serine/threonine protein kinase